MNNDSELVLGIIQTVGTNSVNIISCIEDSLKKFHYKVKKIKVSEMILAEFSENNTAFQREFERISFFMDLGNDIRKKTGDASILMKGVCAYIYKNYRENSGEGPCPRMAYIVDSIKHPDEVDFLRKTYGDGFHLIGISADYEERKKYLVNRKNLSEDEAAEILDRDDNEEEKNGQHTRDSYQQADYFISANDNQAECEAAIFRLLDLLFGNSFISPTFSEYAMFRAYVASLRSADLSRQIGAVVANEETREVIAEGVNDCPKAFGGVYWPITKDGEIVDEEDGRDYMRGFDSNKIEQQKIVTGILKNLELEDSMENRKKIKAAGIRKVVYIEPYPKSKTLEFYQREISQNPNDKESKVLFLPFKGVGPHRFIDLFSMKSIKWYSRTRKDSDGNVIKWERDKANLRNPMSILNYIDTEKSAYKQYMEEINGIREGR